MPKKYKAPTLKPLILEFILATAKVLNKAVIIENTTFNANTSLGNFKATLFDLLTLSITLMLNFLVKKKNKITYTT